MPLSWPCRQDWNQDSWTENPGAYKTPLQHSQPLPLRFSIPDLPHSEHTAEVVSGGVVNPLEMKDCLGARLESSRALCN